MFSLRIVTSYMTPFLVKDLKFFSSVLRMWMLHCEVLYLECGCYTVKFYVFAVVWMRYPFFEDVMPCHWVFGSHWFEILKWSHLKRLRGPRRPFDTVSHPRRMDAGCYTLLYQSGEVNLAKYISGVGISSIFG